MNAAWFRVRSVLRRDAPAVALGSFGTRSVAPTSVKRDASSESQRKLCDRSRTPSLGINDADVVCQHADGGSSKSASADDHRAEEVARGRKDIPEARGLPLLGTLPALVISGGAKKLHEYVSRRHRELGPIYRERIGPVDAIFVNSPHEFRRIFRLEGPKPKHFLPEAWVLYNEIRKCRRGLLFMDGDEWLHFRRVLNKLMLVSDSTSLMSVPCENAAVSLAENWKPYLETGNGVVSELEAQLYRWSIEAMLATLVGSSWSKHKEQISQQSDNLARTLHRIFECSSTLSMLPSKLAMSLNLSVWKKFVSAADTALGIVRTLVPEMAVVSANDGLLSMMMREDIRDDDLVRIVADFILAAGDTTAFSMQWALLMLSTHPELQQKLYEKTVDLSSRDLIRDSLVRGVIKETLRLHPIAPFVTRYLPEDGVIGGYHVRKGELLLLSIYSSSRDSKNFPHPDSFDPERWMRTEEGNYRGVINPHASLPFALGARSCIGRKLAETQMALALGQLIRTFQITCVNGDRVKMILHLISVPSEPIRLKLTMRSQL